MTCAGSDGALIVTTARASGIAMRGGEHGGAAEAVADQDRGRGEASAQVVGGGDRSSTLEENVVLANSPSLAPSPVKSKRSTAMPCCFQTVGDAPCGPVVLAAGEAMREQRDRARRRGRAVEQRASCWPSALWKSNRSAGIFASWTELCIAYCQGVVAGLVPRPRLWQPLRASCLNHYPWLEEELKSSRQARKLTPARST